MALILNIETATAVCSAALAKDGNVISLKESNEGNVHAEKLAVLIQDTLAQSGHSLKELDAVAVGTGPGSYTGLRIGTSTAKGLCYGLGKPLIAIPTLKAMATAAITKAGNADLFCPLIDARRLEVYMALFDKAGKEIEPVQAMILNEESFLNYRNNHTIAFFGDGMPKMKSLFPASADMLWVEDVYASASNMAKLAEEAFNESKFADVAYYEPFYLKDFIAKKKGEK